MKKFLVSILAVLYFTASSGVVLNMHYCMGHLASVKLDNVAIQNCMCGPEEQNDDCCHDEMKVLKVSSVHKASAAVFNTISTLNIVLPSNVSLIDISKLPSQKVERTTVYTPPDKVGPSNTILHCVFLI